MEIKNAVAGTLESGDIMIQIAPGDGLQVELQSSVAAQFGRQIKALITETLTGLGIDFDLSDKTQRDDKIGDMTYEEWKGQKEKKMGNKDGD